MTPLLLVAILASCDDDPPARPAAPPAPPPRALEGRGVVLDLLREWTGADLFEGDHLVIDFGTARDAIYTLGGAETGWGPALDDGVSYRVAFGRTSQLLLPAEPADLVLTLELRSEGARTVGVSWNGRMLEWLELGRQERFRSHSVRIPRAAVVAGTNRVAFASLSTADSPHGVPTTFSLAKLTLGPEGEAASAVTEEAGALLVRSPARLAYWIAPPDRAALSLAASCDEGSARLRVRATNDDGATELVSESIEARASRHEQEIAMGRAPIRLEIAVADLAGGCDLRISELALHGARREPIALSATKLVLVVADTFRADRMRAVAPGSTVPNAGLDRLASEGVTFSFAHSTTNWTLPAVVSLLTSLHPPAHGVSTPRDAVRDDEVLLPEILNDAGFATALFAANGYVSEGFGLRQGWDEYRNYVEEQDQASYREARADRVFADGLRFIREHREERFFVYLHTFDPHAPYDAPPEFLARIDPEPMDDGALVDREVSAAMLGDLQRNRLRPTAREEARIRALYDAEVAYHDAELASFLEALDRDGLLRDTLVVFASDHGEELADHGSYGHMHSPYEELVHVPLVVRHASIRAMRSEDAVSIVDVAPTILHAAGIESPAAFQGRSLLDAGASFAHAVSFVDGSHALVTRDAKLLVHPDQIFANDYWLDLGDGERTPESAAARPIATRFAYVALGRIFGRGRSLPPADGPAEAEVPAMVADQLRALGYGR